MTRIMGIPTYYVVALVAAAIVFAFAAAPHVGTSCGTIRENGTRMAAACMSEDEMRTVMYRIHSERGGRAWEDGR